MEDGQALSLKRLGQATKQFKHQSEQFWPNSIKKLIKLMALKKNLKNHILSIKQNY